MRDPGYSCLDAVSVQRQKAFHATNPGITFPRGADRIARSGRVGASRLLPWSVVVVRVAHLFGYYFCFLFIILRDGGKGFLISGKNKNADA